MKPKYVTVRINCKDFNHMCRVFLYARQSKKNYMLHLSRQSWVIKEAMQGFTVQCQLRASQYQGQQRHARIHPVVGLSEVGCVGKRVHLRGDLVNTGQGVHDDHVVGAL